MPTVGRIIFHKPDDQHPGQSYGYIFDEAVGYDRETNFFFNDLSCDVGVMFARGQRVTFNVTKPDSKGRIRAICLRAIEEN